MADLHRSTAPEEDAHGASHREATTGMPRWVKLFGVIAIVVVVVFLFLMFIGAHDPSRFAH